MTLRHAVSALMVGASLVTGVVCFGATPQAGAGEATWLTPVKDTYQPGDQATVIGYTEGDEQLGNNQLVGAPYYGYLRVNPAEAYHDMTGDSTSGRVGTGGPFVHHTDVPLGEVQLERTLRRDWAEWRVSLDFTLPEDLAPDPYELLICNDPCTQELSNGTGGTVYVGVSPERGIVRQWPYDEPAIAQLDDDALISAPGGYLTAEQVRAGDVGSPEPFPPQTTRPPQMSEDDFGAPAGDADVRSVAAAEQSTSRKAFPWLAILGVAAAAFFFIRRGGPRRKHVKGTSTTTSGQRPPGASRWPGRVARL